MTILAAVYPSLVTKPKRGLLAFLATVVVALLVLASAQLLGLATDGTGVAATPADSGPSAAAPETPTSSPTRSSAPPRSLDFVLSSFNVLGSSHTEPGGGKRASMPSGQTRIRWAARLLARHGVDVVGFQEFQLDQQRAFLRVTGAQYDIYPGFDLGGRGSNNSIAWRTDTWDLVESDTIDIPYFDGKPWPMPVVLLRNRDTGLRAYFTNFHNPASTASHPNQGRWRRLAAAREVALVNRLTRQTDYPVLLTGDLNEREIAFCTMTGRADMTAANGGSHDGACRPPDQIGIDWIFGSAGVRFSNYRADRSALVNRTTDHPMIVSRVRIEG